MGTARPPAREFEEVALLAGPGNAAERLARWGRLLEEHADRIDVLVTWGADPDLDARNAHRFREADRWGELRVWTRRGP